MTREYLDTSIEYLKGVGPKRAELLRDEIKVRTFGDLLSYFPFRYVDRSKFYPIREVQPDLMYVQVRGILHNLQQVGEKRGRRLTAVLSDQSGELDLVWFQGIKWLKESLKPGMEYVVFGRPSVFNQRINIVHPEMEPAAEHDRTISQTLQGIYPMTEKLKTSGLNNKNLVKLIKTLIMNAQGRIPETLPPEILARLHLVPREDAVRNIHFPENPEGLRRAQARLKFEELFFIQLSLLKDKLLRQQKIKGYVFAKVGDFLNRFYNEKLPFELTGAQKRVIREIRKDTGSGKQMNRLLQGDVGSGKTLVALMAMLIALDNGYQACMMAPTEILANQHLKTLVRMTEGLGIRIELLTGSTPSSRRKTLLADLEEGSIGIIVGTHALIEESVKFNNPGIVIIDEQHRFGVAQRASLWMKSDVAPHILVMTATPIPRTLAMTLYGDLDVSVIDELPPGRKPVKTYLFDDSKRLKLWGFLKERIAEGRQVYIVYPLINESETLDFKHLMDGYESISRDFPPPDYAVSVVHGRMKSQDKDYEMQRFLEKKTQIMVATNVIEVGVDIPNATVMVIESPERFGLSQLHQLRGRVGRGADQSHCILMAGDKLSNEARRRLEVMVQTGDGFRIAEEDLRMRGPGDLAGTRQSGLIELKVANLVQDEKILKYARGLATEILTEDPALEMEKNRLLATQLTQKQHEMMNWSIIS